MAKRGSIHTVYPRIKLSNRLIKCCLKNWIEKIKVYWFKKSESRTWDHSNERLPDWDICVIDHANNMIVDNGLLIKDKTTSQLRYNCEFINQRQNHITIDTAIILTAAILLALLVV